MEEATDIPTKRRVDGITAVMLVVTVAALVGAGWLRTRHKPADQPPVAGALAPPLRLLDLQSAEPILLVGLRGKVVWVVFWSAESTSHQSSLEALEPAWNALKAQSRFAMVAAAVEADKPERVRTVVAEARVKLPVYLASADTRRRFGATQAEPPLSVLIDADGKIVALARGTSPQTIARITDQSRRLLDELGPEDDTRFASNHMAPAYCFDPLAAPADSGGYRSISLCWASRPGRSWSRRGFFGVRKLASAVGSGESGSKLPHSKRGGSPGAGRCGVRVRLKRSEVGARIGWCTRPVLAQRFAGV